MWGIGIQLEAAIAEELGIQRLVHVNVQLVDEVCAPVGLSSVWSWSVEGAFTGLPLMARVGCLWSLCALQAGDGKSTLRF